MKNLFIMILLISTLLNFCLQELIAQIPRTISYQGRIIDEEGNPLNGQQQLTLSLFSSETGGTPQWRESKSIELTDGYFNTILGESVELLIDFSNHYWLEVKLEDNEPYPRIPLSSVPYALKSLSSKSSDTSMVALKTIAIDFENTELTGIVPEVNLPNTIAYTDRENSFTETNNFTNMDVSGQLNTNAISIGSSEVIITGISKDTTLSSNSNAIVTTQKAIKSYVDNSLKNAFIPGNIAYRDSVNNFSENNIFDKKVDINDTLTARYYKSVNSPVLINEFSNDSLLASESESILVTEQAIKKYVDRTIFNGNIPSGFIAVFADSNQRSGWTYTGMTETKLKNHRYISKSNYEYSDKHIAIWTGTEMIIYGNYVFNIGYLSGLKYNPLSDSWSEISSTNAQPVYEDYSYIWTGTDMIIWGGRSFDGRYYMNTGARYNPATDTWTSLSTTNAPEGRFGHTAVWTGTDMIVWGGRNSVDAGIITGGKYNPLTDTWTSLSTTNAPAGGRLHPKSIWTGSEMIIWGGVPYLNAGGKYNPATDTWTLTSTNNAPLSTLDHTAVWTGSEMIIWGGSRSNGGGRYNPQSDTWTSLSINNFYPLKSSVAGSANTQAFYSNNKMIVWAIDEGAIYDTQNNKWIKSIPKSNITGQAVWTGSELIIWGGSSYSVSVGGKINPENDVKVLYYFQKD